MDDADMQDTNFGQSQSAADNQSLTSAPFSHGSLSIRNTVPDSFISSASNQAPQDDVQSTSQIAINPFDTHMAKLKENPTELVHICVQKVFEQLGSGRMTPEDILYYSHFNHFPARSTDDLEIDVEFTLTPKDGDTFTSICIETLPASICNTFSNLFRATKNTWREVYSQAIAPFPITGIWANNSKVMFMDTHGDDRGNWKAARGAERYAKWYHDHVVHGRNTSLKLHLMYKEVA